MFEFDPDMLINDQWVKLVVLNRTLMLGAAIENIDVEQTVFEFTGDPVEDEMFIAAANRMIDRRGLDLLRIDVHDGTGAFLMSVGRDRDDARDRMRRFYENVLEGRSQ